MVVPIAPKNTWMEAKAFARQIADSMVKAEPEKYIATMSKAARRGKIFIDYLRNERGAHVGGRVFKPGKTNRPGLDANRLGRTGQASRASSSLCKTFSAISKAAQRSLETDGKFAPNTFLTKQLDCFAMILSIHARVRTRWLNRSHPGARRTTFSMAHGPNFPQNSQNRARRGVCKLGSNRVGNLVPKKE